MCTSVLILRKRAREKREWLFFYYTCILMRKILHVFRFSAKIRVRRKRWRAFLFSRCDYLRACIDCGDILNAKARVKDEKKKKININGNSIQRREVAFYLPTSPFLGEKMCVQEKLEGGDDSFYRAPATLIFHIAGVCIRAYILFTTLPFAYLVVG